MILIGNRIGAEVTMSDNPSRMRSREEQFAPCNVTEQEAFDRYRQLARPTPRAVAEHFRQLGRKLSRSKVERWARRGMWRAKINAASPSMIIDPETLLADLTVEGQRFTPEVIRGLICRIVLRMADQLEHLPIREPGDFLSMIDVFKALDELAIRFGARTSLTPIR
jgi:hypothetical protein